MTCITRRVCAWLLALAIAIAVGRVAAIEDGAQIVADDAADAVVAAQVAAKGKP